MGAREISTAGFSLEGGRLDTWLGLAAAIGPADLSLSRVVEVAVAMLVAYLCALPIGWEERREKRTVGLRTFTLVAIGSCAYALVGKAISAGDPTADARILQGLVAGIGFVGGGAIVKRKDDVEGLATATGIWSTGAMGFATAYRLYALAVLLSLANLLILRRARLKREKKAEP